MRAVILDNDFYPSMEDKSRGRMKTTILYYARVIKKWVAKGITPNQIMGFGKDGLTAPCAFIRNMQNIKGQET